MTKKIFTVLLFSLAATAPIFAQKFTKREQARREARENYYFCGNSFTLTAGYNHAWLTAAEIDLSSPAFGKSEKLANTVNRFNAGFLWDHAFKNSKKWSLQSGLFYTMKGGEHLYYYDAGFGKGPQLRDEETETLNIQAVEAQVLWRRSFALAYDQRITLNAGPYVSKFIDAPSGIKGWDFGVTLGVGFDYKHWAASISYQPGVFPFIADDCYTRQANIAVNVGWRFWKK